MKTRIGFDYNRFKYFKLIQFFLLTCCIIINLFFCFLFFYKRGPRHWALQASISFSTNKVCFRWGPTYSIYPYMLKQHTKHDNILPSCQQWPLQGEHELLTKQCFSKLKKGGDIKSFQCQHSKTLKTRRSDQLWTSGGRRGVQSNHWTVEGWVLAPHHTSKQGKKTDVWKVTIQLLLYVVFVFVTPFMKCLSCDLSWSISWHQWSQVNSTLIECCAFQHKLTKPRGHWTEWSHRIQFKTLS